MGWMAPAVAFVAALAATWCVLRLSRFFGRLDQPGAHSSHHTAMPTAGGLGIIAGFWSGIIVLWGAGSVFHTAVVQLVFPLVVCCGILALVLVDDIVRPLAVWEKAAVQIAGGAAWILMAVPFGALQLPVGPAVDLGQLAWLVTLLWIAAVCNIYNFMDGIDGISASQIICMSLFALLLYRQAESDLWILPLILACAALGFLVFNLPPGRIFMGDVGSMFLGFMVAIMGILAHVAGIPLWVFSLILGYYICDTGYTVVRRALKKENILQGHRKHLYQRLNKLGWSHVRIDLLALTLSSLFGASALSFQSNEKLVGLGLAGTAIGILIALVVWVERKDPSFV